METTSRVLVVDANILFAALIRDAATARLLANKNYTFFAPDFLFEEIDKYTELLLEKTKRTNFHEAKEFFINRITIVKQPVYQHLLSQIDSPDQKDLPYLALAHYLDCPLWSEDKQLKEQTLVDVVTTKNLLERG